MWRTTEEVNDEGRVQGVRGNAWILSHGTAWADSVPQMRKGQMKRHLSI